MKIANYYFLAFILCFSIFTTADAQTRSRRSKKKASYPSGIKLGYQDLTARYNTYFHAKLSLTEGFKKLTDIHQDNYDELLSIYEYIDLEQASQVNPEMDRAIEKASKSIYRHEISKWVDDCYLIMGKGFFVKGEYDEALTTFKYITSEFHDGKKRIVKGSKKKKSTKRKKLNYKKQKKKATKKKKKDAKDDDKDADDNFLNFLDHKTIKDEALLWLIKTYITVGQYTEAQSLLALAKNDDEFSEGLRDELEILHTYYHIKRQNYDLAITTLSEGIELISLKNKKTRYQFILGQLYAKQNNNFLAIQSFNEVLELAPEYELAFNAKINIAKAYEDSKQTQETDIENILLKMAKDRKNVEYLDQIYYYLAKITLKDGKTPEGKELLETSIAYSSKNNKQKALSFLKLGELAYAEENYALTKNYYDSTLIYLPQTYYDYERISNSSNTLSLIVEQVAIITKEDTLQYLYSLTQNEREKYLDEVIEEMRKKDIEASLKSSSIKLIAFEDNTETASSGEWYFYSASAKADGYKDFIDKWGKRPLEDNWRRANKESVANETEEETSEIVKTTTGSKNYEAYKQSLLKAIPIDENNLQTSIDKEARAKFALANIYKENLNDNKEAIILFKEIADEGGAKELTPQVYYNLYLLNKRNGNLSESDKYKNKIITEFPETDFAKFILNANYFNELNKSSAQVQEIYETTYHLYNEGYLDKALTNINMVDSLYPETDLKPKFDLLKTLIIGQTKDIDNFRAALKNIINIYPNHEVRFKAKQILVQIDEIQSTDIKEDNKKSSSIFDYKDADPHFVCIVAVDSAFTGEETVSSLANYNNKYHKLDKYKVSTTVVKQQYVILIKEFPNYTKANLYVKEIKDQKDISNTLKNISYKIVTITNNNLGQVYKNDSFDEYWAFYDSNYK